MNTGERLDIAGIVGDLVIPCDVTTRHPAERPPATYIAWVETCCPSRKDVGFICTDCLGYAIATVDPCRCRNCGHRWERVGLWLKRYEPIDR